MDYEDFVVTIYTPIKTIELISDIIYTKCNEDWEFYNSTERRKDIQELISLNFAINLCSKYILEQRKLAYDEISKIQ